MRRFRILLSLLLCLTVPVAGASSLLSGSLCPQQHHHEAADVADHDDGDADHHPHADHALASTGELGHGYAHCGDLAGHGKSCPGDHCSCGCGVGACSTSSLPLLTVLPMSFPVDANRQSLPRGDVLPYAGTLDASPLRPPIS